MAWRDRPLLRRSPCGGGGGGGVLLLRRRRRCAAVGVGAAGGCVPRWRGGGRCSRGSLGTGGAGRAGSGPPRAAPTSPSRAPPSPPLCAPSPRSAAGARREGWGGWATCVQLAGEAAAAERAAAAGGGAAWRDRGVPPPQRSCAAAHGGAVEAAASCSSSSAAAAALRWRRLRAGVGAATAALLNQYESHDLDVWTEAARRTPRTHGPTTLAVRKHGSMASRHGRAAFQRVSTNSTP